LTFESIYAYAEIKSSWDKKYIDDFITTRERMFNFLKRDSVDPNYIDTGGKGFLLDLPTTNYPCKNPLFGFMFIGDSNNFDFKHIEAQYKFVDWKFLPNIICLFDKGIVVNINKKDLDNKVFKINLYPEFISENKEDNEWILLNFDKKRSALGTLYYIVLEHLNTCTLNNPNMLEYMQNIFEINPDNIDFINDFSL